MRQLLNVLYVHLRPPHLSDCRQQCAGGCPRVQFHDWLEGPLQGRDQRMHERFRQRREALWRGEIPA
ncbi:hypothetical protein M2302_000264 [Micromonospora sp. A200]|uniref:hypothetical protein n=1 Tax=Micromonospora sp. A200 TaxID=2940568 RepID=UPI002475693F|nr:hypothetical protein [Micromonospora sp. A200]MDH6460113.1 hypothetical protein [Micromonospora sp. A200]